MLGRSMVWLLALALMAALPLSAVAAEEGSAEVLGRRDDNQAEVIVQDDGDDDDDESTASGYTSGVSSNDKTGSGHSAVSRDRDRSRGDRTRDWTKDGGSRTRDRSRNHTNDGTRNDTR